MKNNTRIELGTVVQAIRGRDEGEIFVIQEIVSDDMVKIANGKKRKIEKPKLKKIMHLRVSNKKIDLNEITSNKNLRQKLEEMEVFRG